MTQNPVSQPWTKWEFLIFVGLLLLAAYLRLDQPGIAEFKRDEANLSQLALDVVYGRDLPLLGIGSSVGFPNAPLNVYILALPYALNSNPVIATQFVGLLNVFAIAAVYLLARRYAGRGAAIIAGILFTVSPWSIIFSRKIWAQNMLPLFVVLIVFSALKGFVEGKRSGQWTHLPLLVITGQIHYAAFVMVPVSAYLIWQGRRRLRGAFAFSIVIAVLLTLPYVVGLARSNLDLSYDALTSSQVGKSPSLSLTTEALRSAGVIIAGTEIHALAGPVRYEEYRAQLPNIWSLFTLIAFGVLAATFWLIIRGIRLRDSRTPVDIALILWLSIPVIAFSATWTAFYIHYLIPLLPAAYLIIGFGVYDLQQSLTNRPRMKQFVLITTSSVIAGILGLQIWAWMTLLDFVDQNYTPDGFGTPLHYLMPIRETILEHDSKQVIGVFEGNNPDYDEESAIWRTLLYNGPTVRFENSGVQVYPPVDTLLISRHVCSDTPDSYPLREPAEGCYQLAIRQPDELDLSQYEAVPAGIHFANGVEVLGYRWKEDSCLDLVWEINQPGILETNFAIHFFDNSGDRVAVADGLSWAMRFWQPGDRVVSTYCTTQDPAIQYVDIGMYAFKGNSIIGIVREDEMGNTREPMVRLLLVP